MKFRKLTANEIDVRVGTVTADGISLLLYKDARCDMNMLDESGVLWQRKHELIDGTLYCRVGIKIEDEWVWRQDCGTESMTEKEKGRASDSFKRACFNWGIGRELYTAPFIWVTDVAIVNKKVKDKFYVKSISYDGDNIKDLEIVNQRGEVVYGKNKKLVEKAVEKPVICPKCNKPIKGGKNKAGEYTSPQEILKKLGSCAACYK